MYYIDQINVSHRTSTKEDASIIVKFNSRRTRNLFWSGRKKIFGKTIKELKLGDSDKNIYINENLTAGTVTCSSCAEIS